MAKAIELLRNNFGVSQLYQHEVLKNGQSVLTVYWHPLTISEREAINKKTGQTEDANDFALALMIEKALDSEGKRLFTDGDKVALRREIEAAVLQEIQLAMLESGTDKEVEEAKAELKS